MLRWIRNGFQWFDEAEHRPDGWNPVAQLEGAGLTAWPSMADTEFRSVGDFNIRLHGDVGEAEMNVAA